MKRPGQATMECPGCGKHEEMREWNTFDAMQHITAWRAPVNWEAVRGRFYCKACIDTFEATKGARSPDPTPHDIDPGDIEHRLRKARPE